MKLLIFLMLAALPLYCYAGSGCQLMYDAINKTLSESVSPDEYINIYAEFLEDDSEVEAFRKMKQCYYQQSNDTLENVIVMMVEKQMILKKSLNCAVKHETSQKWEKRLEDIFKEVQKIQFEEDSAHVKLKE